MQWLTKLVRGGLYVWMFFSVVFAVLFYWMPLHAQLNRFGMGFFSNVLGASALCSAGAAVAIWIVRKVYIEVKRRKFPDFDVTRQTLLFLRKHHILFGWATILAASAHGVYYLLLYPYRQLQVFTGSIAWLCLVFLAGVGVWLNEKLTTKKMNSKRTRMHHFTWAVIFLFFLAVHVV